MSVLFIYIVTHIFLFFVSAATGAATRGYSGTVNAAVYVGLLGFHNAVYIVRGRFLFI